MPLSVSAGRQAEELIAWVDETDLDGFNLAYVVTPETFTDFVDLLVPELQGRGCYKIDYASDTLREKLYGLGRARLGKAGQPKRDDHHGGTAFPCPHEDRRPARRSRPAVLPNHRLAGRKLRSSGK
jgi:hypothetical protein